MIEKGSTRSGKDSLESGKDALEKCLFVGCQLADQKRKLLAVLVRHGLEKAGEKGLHRGEQEKKTSAPQLLSIDTFTLI